MDLGLTGRRAIVYSSFKGLRLACATSLACEGATVWINGRDDARLRIARAGMIALDGGASRAVLNGGGSGRPRSFPD